MKGLVIRWLILTLSIFLAAYWIDGIQVGGFHIALFAAAVLGVLNALLRPVLILLTLPLNVLTLGLFTFVINAFLLKVTSAIIPGFDIRGFWPAILGALVISLVNGLLSTWMTDKKSARTSDSPPDDVIDLQKKGKRWG